MPVELRALLNNARGLVKPLSPQLTGKIYEELALVAFQKRFGPSGLDSMKIVGRAGDRGVDLIAKWKTIDLLVQCKARSSTIPGEIWRDLGGVHSQRISMAQTPTLVALASPMPMSAAAFSEFMSSENPYMHCILPKAKLSAKDALELAAIKSVVLNSAAEALLAENDITI